MKFPRKMFVPGLTALICGTAIVGTANAHPHVFIEANLEVVRNDKGQFTELRQVWRFDELFSSTIIIDFDENTDGKLDEGELKKVTSIVKESIAEYDFYTAMRAGTKPIEFYEPEEIGAYFEDGKMIMFLALELSKPFDFSEVPLKISPSDTSYYVAFDFDKDSITVSGNPGDCTTDVVHPDFDALYANNAETLTESFFNDPTNAGFGDEFYSWATIRCS